MRNESAQQGKVRVENSIIHGNQQRKQQGQSEKVTGYESYIRPTLYKTASGQWVSGERERVDRRE